MKKFIYAGIIVLFVIAACHKKTIPVIMARTIEPPPPPRSTPVFTSPVVEAGHAVFTTKCVRCHAAKPLQRWTIDEWKPILNVMIPRAKLDSIQTVQVAAYVEAFARRQ